MHIADADNILIDDVHRIGRPNHFKPRPIILRLVLRTDRNRIWDARHTLKNTQIYLGEDLPDEYQKARGLLMPIFNRAKLKGAKASMVNDKIRINGNLYGVNDLHLLPPEFSPEQACVSEKRNVICFFGRYTPLSNFYKCQFVVDGQEYNCLEQYLQKSKAEFLHDDITAQKILTLSDPADQKSAARNIKDQQNLWSKVAQKEVRKALVARFSQNADLQQYLISTGDKQLAEASRDPDWGVGLTLRDPNIMDNNLWRGKTGWAIC
jgi:ribA/ribD-fused uncharacterized protein